MKAAIPKALAVFVLTVAGSGAHAQSSSVLSNISCITDGQGVGPGQATCFNQKSGAAGAVRCTCNATAIRHNASLPPSQPLGRCNGGRMRLAQPSLRVRHVAAQLRRSIPARLLPFSQALT